MMPTGVVADEEVTYTDWTSTSKLPSSSGAYKLTKNVTVTSYTQLTSGTDVTLDLNGYTITVNISGAAAYFVYSGAILTIEDSSGGDGVIDVVSGGGIYVMGGTLNLTGGTITIKSTATNPLYLIYMYQDSSVVNISGGNLTTERADVTFIGTYGNGTYNITGGTFTNNSGDDTAQFFYNATENGYAVSITGGTFVGFDSENTSGNFTYYIEDGYEYNETTGAVAVASTLDATWVEYTNVRNGYDLAVGFYIPKSKLDSTYTVKVTFNVATYSSGWVKTSTTVEIDSSEWTEDTVGSTEYWVIIYDGIWAMQYAEDITIDIYDSNGTKVCESYTDSIADYEARYVEKYSSYTSAVNLANALLSYCSAAKTYYGY